MILGYTCQFAHCFQSKTVQTLTGLDYHIVVVVSLVQHHTWQNNFPSPSRLTNHHRVCRVLYLNKEMCYIVAFVHHCLYTVVQKQKVLDHHKVSVDELVHLHKSLSSFPRVPKMTSLRLKAQLESNKAILNTRFMSNNNCCILIQSISIRISERLINLRKLR